MATFNNLPNEIQEAIWELVIAAPGVHYVQVEGLPMSEPLLKSVLAEHDNNWRYNDFLAFLRIHLAIPSVWGKYNESNEPLPQSTAAQDRHVSAYTQQATLLSTCRMSRAVASAHIAAMRRPTRLYRGLGPRARPHAFPLRRVWTRGSGDTNEDVVADYDDGTSDDELNADSAAASDADDYHADAPKGRTRTTLMLDGWHDLIVLRLHSAADGWANATLRHVRQLAGADELDEALCEKRLPFFTRVGIQWHDAWGTRKGRPGLCEAGLTLLLAEWRHSPWVYFVVDGVPRPRWGEGGLAAVWQTMRERNARQHVYLNTDWRNRPDHPLLDEEFEGNGRRYYTVHVIDDYDIYGVYPGGKHLWHEKLRRPMKVLRELYLSDTWTSARCAMTTIKILSWEPI